MHVYMCFRIQEMFKLSLTSPELRLRVIKGCTSENLRKPPAPVYPRYPDDKENVSMVECEQKRKHTQMSFLLKKNDLFSKSYYYFIHVTVSTLESTNTKVATVSPTKKVPAVSRNIKSLLQANRKIGRKIEVELVKGPRGLGFSITTRDNPTGGNCPIYIKSIMTEVSEIFFITTHMQHYDRIKINLIVFVRGQLSKMGDWKSETAYLR